CNTEGAWGSSAGVPEGLRVRLGGLREGREEHEQTGHQAVAASQEAGPIGAACPWPKEPARHKGRVDHAAEGAEARCSQERGCREIAAVDDHGGGGRPEERRQDEAVAEEP